MTTYLFVVEDANRRSEIESSIRPLVEEGRITAYFLPTTIDAEEKLGYEDVVIVCDNDLGSRNEGARWLLELRSHGLLNRMILLSERKLEPEEEASLGVALIRPITVADLKDLIRITFELTFRAKQ